MSESPEQMKRRLEFLKSERRQNSEEFERLKKQGKWTGIGGILHALSGDGSAATSNLQAQGIIARLEDINRQNRKLDFEIETLEAEMRKSEQGFRVSVGDERMGRSCPSCGKIIPLFPTDMKHCPYCGSELKVTTRVQGWANVEYKTQSKQP